VGGGEDDDRRRVERDVGDDGGPQPARPLRHHPQHDAERDERQQLDHLGVGEAEQHGGEGNRPPATQAALERALEQAAEEQLLDERRNGTYRTGTITNWHSVPTATPTGMSRGSRRNPKSVASRPDPLRRDARTAAPASPVHSPASDAATTPRPLAWPVAATHALRVKAWKTKPAA